MKRTLVCILILALLLPLSVHAEGFLNFFFGAPSSGLTLQYVPLQDKAFVTTDGEMTARLMGTSGDGNMLLLYNPFELYLWDQSIQSRIPVSFARPEDAEAMTQLAPMAVINMIGRNLNREQRTEKLEQLAAQQEEFLGKRGLTAFADLDQIAECFPHIVQLSPQCAGISDHWALVNCVYYPCALAIDLRNGEALAFFRDNQPRSFCKDRILLAEGVLDLETREMTTMDKLDLMPAEEDGRPDLNMAGLSQSMRLCADGSLFAIGCEGTLDFENGNDYWLINIRADSNRAFRIGKFTYHVAPNTSLVSQDERYLLLYNPSALMWQSVLTMDRETGEVGELEAGKYLPVGVCGKGFLLWDLQTYDAQILDPETNEISKVSLGSGFDWTRMDLTAVSGIVGNGTGMFFPTSPIMRRDSEPTIVHGYFVLEGE